MSVSGADWQTGCAEDNLTEAGQPQDAMTLPPVRNMMPGDAICDVLSIGLPCSCI